MDFPSVLAVALGLSADCFAVAVGGGVAMTGLSFYRVFRTSLSFGLFQALMPVLGWLAGRTVVDLIADYDHWVAFVLLAIVGGRMVWESFRAKAHTDAERDITRGILLLTLSVATSIDALAVGLSFAFVEIDILPACATIGVVSFAVTSVGLFVGSRAGKMVGRRAETVGGIVLIGIGLRVLLSHVW